jgi:hypothetical protein
VGLSVVLVGQASKRGIIPRLPSGDRLVADMERWLTAEYTDSLRSTRRQSGPAGSAQAHLRLALHPAAPEVAISADDTGRLTAHATTSSVGPGYHTFVCRLLERLGQELSIAWNPTTGTDPSSDDAGFLGEGGRPVAERTFLAWLGGSLGSAREARRRGRPGMALGTPMGVSFAFDGAIATPLGPRDDRWLDAALADPRVAIDVWPWWADMIDARCILNRALSLMWTEVRWRAPVTPEEAKTMDEVLALLHRAYPLDPALGYPWREWLEIMQLRSTSERTVGQVADRAANEDAGRPRIGYRREPVTMIHEGWQLEVPGTFAERRTEEEWWGGEGGRGITLAAVETAADGRPMPPEVFLAQVATDLGSDALTHRDGSIVGRARLNTETRSGIAVGMLEGYSAVTGSGAAIRIEFDDPAYWQWALEIWRALRPATPQPVLDLSLADIRSGRPTRSEPPRIAGADRNRGLAPAVVSRPA